MIYINDVCQFVKYIFDIFKRLPFPLDWCVCTWTYCYDINEYSRHVTRDGMIWLGPTAEVRSGHLKPQTSGPHFLLLTSQTVINCFIIILSLSTASLLENHQLPILKSILIELVLNQWSLTFKARKLWMFVLIWIIYQQTNKQTNVLFANQWRPYEQNNHIINLYTMITIICVWFKTCIRTNTELNVRSCVRVCVLYVLVFDLLIYWFKSQFYISIKFNKQK